MIKEDEIKYYRQNIISKYVSDVMTKLEHDERIYELQEIERKAREKKLKYDPNYKQCKRCGKVKKLSEFYKNPIKSKGVFDYCKECAKSRQRELRRLKNA